MNPVRDSEYRQPVGKLLYALAVCILALGILPATAWSQGLLLQNVQGKTLFSIPMQDGESFAIRYIHSVTQTPVLDYFIIKNNKIWLDRTVYQDFGAGLPHAPDRAQEMRMENGRIILGGFNLRLPEFELRVGRVAGHTLILHPDTSREKSLPLADLAPPGETIRFSTE